MPEWLGAILVIALIFGGAWLYESWKEKAQDNGGTGAKVAQAAEAVEGGLSRVAWFFMKTAGVVFVLLAILILAFLDIDFKTLLGALVLGGYGIYLLAPGDDKWFFIPF